MVKLQDLINRGDVISITNGKLNIIPNSGKAVPEKWLQDNKDCLLKQICVVAQQPIYQFIFFGVGRYKGLYDGIHMNFTDLKFHKDYYTIFNVSLNRKTKHGRLTGKRFNPPAQGALLKFWNRSNLPKPRRPSELYKKINMMKNYLWQAEVDEGNYLDKKSLRLAIITHKQILDGISGGVSAAREGQSSGVMVSPNSDSLSGQNKEASIGGNELPNNHICQGIDKDQTTCIDNYGHNEPRALTTTGFNNYDISNQGSAVRGNAFPPIESLEEGKKAKPQDQTNIEWLDDYGELDDLNIYCSYDTIQ